MIPGVFENQNLDHRSDGATLALGRHAQQLLYLDGSSDGERLDLEAWHAASSHGCVANVLPYARGCRLGCHPLKYSVVIARRAVPTRHNPAPTREQAVEPSQLDSMCREEASRAPVGLAIPLALAELFGEVLVIARPMVLGRLPATENLLVRRCYEKAGTMAGFL